MAFWQFAILLVVVNSAIWVQFDAANLRDRYQIGVGPRGWPPHRWSALVFLVWPVALPLYLRARDAATLEDPRTGPPPRFVNGALDSFAIGVGLAGLGLFAVLLVYGHLFPSLLGLVIAVAGVFGGRRCRMTGETERVELGEIGFDQKGFSAPPSPVLGEEDDGPPPQDIEKYFAQMGRPADRPAENRPAPSAAPPSPSAPSASAPSGSASSSSTAPPVGVPYDPPPGVPYEPPSTPPPGETPPAVAPPPPPPPPAQASRPQRPPQPVDEARATPPAAHAKSAPTDPTKSDDLLGFALEDDEPATPNVPPVSSPSPSRPAASPPAVPPPARPAAAQPPREAPRQEPPRSAPPPAPPRATTPPAAGQRSAPPPARPAPASRPSAARPGAPRPAPASLGYGAAKARSSDSTKIAIILAVVAVVALAGWGAWAWWSASSSEDPIAAGPVPEASTSPVAEAPVDEAATPPGSGREGAAASAQPVEDYVIQPWLSRYADVMRPLGSALDEVDFGGLEEPRCKALGVALRRAKALEAAPDPQLDQVLRPAFEELDAALAACLSGNEDLWAIQLLQAKESTHETQVLMDERYGYGGVLELELESAIGVDRSRESISGRFLEKEKEAELGF